MGSDRFKRVEAIYHAALARTGEERDSYLDEACQEDESLRAEVASLIAHGGSGFLDDPLTATRPGAGPGSPPLEEGRQLNSYRIVGLLGRGGMGEVYRARDHDLGREVAIKVLPARYAADPDLAARFEREARLLAALNHPNIAAIYGVERAGDVRFLVLELVEGETLEDLLRAGAVPVPVETSLRLAVQIAQALEAAHDKGIIHRDLKPANVKITSEGKVKVLDFGLGKAFSGSDTSVSETGVPSLTVAATERGVIMGTPAYMSPEQARGETGDHRADIWAFGVVLYELLTGESLFARNTLTETLARVLESEPDVKNLLKATPSRVRRLVRRRLEKNPKRRYQHIGDVRLEIADVLAAPREEAEVIPAPSRSLTLVTVVASIVAVASLVGLGIVWAGGDAAAEPEVTHLALTLEAGLHLGAASPDNRLSLARPRFPTFALSPDGRTLVYVGRESEGIEGEAIVHLYRRPLDQARAVAIPGTEGALGPFFSPNGESVGFFAGGELKRVPVDGGEVRTISTSDQEFFGGFASWTRDDRILVGSYGGIRQVPAGGGSLTQLTTQGLPGPYGQGYPTLLPGNHAVLYVEGLIDGSDPSRWDVIVESLDTGDRVVVTEDGSDPRYLSSGHILFTRSGTVMAVGFDVDGLEVRGDPVIVIEDVMFAAGGANTGMNTGVAQLSLSDSGGLAYVPGGVFPELQDELQWVGLDGETETLPIDPGRHLFPRVSPDGTRLAYIEESTGIFNRTIWIYDIELDIGMTLESGAAASMAWSPDSQEIVFSRQTPEGSFELHRRATDGSGTPVRLTESAKLQWPGSWSQNGVLALLGDTGTIRGTLILDMDGTDDPVPFGDPDVAQQWPAFSPNGNWLAYASNETGREEVYVRPYPAGEPAYRVSNDGGTAPVWSPDGDRLFYRAPGEEGAFRMMAVDVSFEPTFTRGRPELVFEGAFAATIPVRGYDISRDGERFLMTVRVEQEPEPVRRIHVVLNWPEELRARMPVP